MKVKISNTNSKHTKDWIGKTGKLILNAPYIAIQLDETGKFINTTAVQKIIIQTQNTSYELEVI